MENPTMEILPSFNAIREKLFTYTLPEVSVDKTDKLAVEAEQARKDRWSEALSTTSPVVQIVKVFDFLKQEISLDATGKQILASCASMIASQGFFGKGAEATAKLTELLTE